MKYGYNDLRKLELDWEDVAAALASECGQMYHGGRMSQDNGRRLRVWLN